MYVCMFELLQSALKAINLKSCWTGWENRITHSFDNLMYSTFTRNLKLCSASTNSIQGEMKMYDKSFKNSSSLAVSVFI